MKGKKFSCLQMFCVSFQKINLCFFRQQDRPEEKPISFTVLIALLLLYLDV